MPRKRRSRIYWRTRGGVRRAYGDFRNLGGGREALVIPGATSATSDPDIAAELASRRVKELEERKRRGVLTGIEREETLARYAEYHLREKARSKEAVASWLIQSECHLRAAVDFFGADVGLPTITPEDLTRYVNHLRGRDNGRGGKLSETTVRKYLNCLSNMYARAVSERYVGSNPVADMYVKPTEDRHEAAYLEPAEAALLLEAARTYQAPLDDGAFAFMYSLLCMFLLTGGRKSEVLGLEVDDVSLRHGKVYFRPNRWRRLKTRGSKRAVPLWPQLREVLEAYLMERERAGGIGTLLFPSARGTVEKMVTDVRKALNHISGRAGFPKGAIRLHQLRHTYTAARLQTCDRGRPVALYTVARELGHRSTMMVEERYGHLHDRTEEGGSEVVEFRVDAYQEQIGERLEALEASS